MAQLAGAAGGEAAVDTAAAPASDPIEALADSFFDEEEKPSDAQPEGEGGEPELTEDDLTDEPDADAPAIKPPVSWTAEEQAKFAELPRDVQETLARRETERERFVQSKANEAAQARQTVEREAVAQVGHIARQHAAMFQTLLPQVPPEPDPMLHVDDPMSYAEQLRYRQHVLAQHQQVQQAIQGAQAQAQQAEQVLKAHAVQEYHAVLSDKFPEFLAQTPEGQKVRDELTSIARELGFPAEAIPNADANEVLAMKQVSDWKADALKYRTLMSKKMETVRAARGLPPLARPGSAATRGQNNAKAAATSFQRAVESKGSARVDNFADYLTKTGLL